MLALGKLILSHIDATGEDKQDFAKRAGVSAQQLSTWVNPDMESLREFPRVPTLKGLASALKISHKELLHIVSADVDYEIEDLDAGPVDTLLVATVRPLPEKQKQRLLQIAKDFAED